MKLYKNSENIKDLRQKVSIAVPIEFNYIHLGKDRK